MCFGVWGDFVCVFILPSFGLFVVHGTVVPLGVVGMFVFLIICYYILGWAWFETVVLFYCCIVIGFGLCWVVCDCSLVRCMVTLLIIVLFEFVVFIRICLFMLMNCCFSGFAEIGFYVCCWCYLLGLLLGLNLLACGVADFGLLFVSVFVVLSFGVTLDFVDGVLWFGILMVVYCWLLCFSLLVMLFGCLVGWSFVGNLVFGLVLDGWCGVFWLMEVVLVGIVSCWFVLFG